MARTPEQTTPRAPARGGRRVASPAAQAASAAAVATADLDPTAASATLDPVLLNSGAHDSAGEATHPDAARGESWVGRTLGHGKYTVVELLGRGGLGTVYRAIQHPVERPVAIKVINRNRADDPVLRKRFQREAAAAAHLKHPAVVALYDFGDEGGELYMVMELVDGEELRALLHRERRLAPKVAVDLVRQICAGLTHAHARGLVHRDLKPENIMISGSEAKELRARILDFGIVKAIRADAPTAGTTQHETRAGVIMGTPAYLAPEQAYAREITAATDQYSLGVVLYEMLAGRLPYSRGSEFEIMTAHCVAPFPPMPPEAGVPRALEVVVQRTMAKRPEDRFPSVQGFAEALQAALERGTAPPIHEATVRAGGFMRVETAEQSGLEPDAGLSSAAGRAVMPRTVDTRDADASAEREPPQRSEAPLGHRRLAAMLLAVGLVGSAGLYAALRVSQPAATPDAGLSVTVLAGGSPGAAVAGSRGGGGGRPAAAAGAPDAATPDAATPDAATPDAATPDAATPDAAPASAPPSAVTSGAQARLAVAAGGRRRRPPGGEPLRPRTVAAAPAAGDCAGELQRIRRASAGASLGPDTPLCKQILALGRRSDAGKCQEPLDGFELMRSLCQ